MNPCTATPKTDARGADCSSPRPSESRSELREMARLLETCFAGIDL